MANTPVQRWALALSGVLTELNKAHHEDLGGWGPGDHTVGWCKNALAKFWNITDEASHAEALAYLWRDGHRTECLEVLRTLPADPSGDDDHQALARKHRSELEGRGLLAWDLGRFVAVTGWGAWAGYLPESEAWRYLHGAATWAQRRYRSWEEFGRHYELGRRWWSGEDDPKMGAVLQKLNTDANSPWVTLPWGYPLGHAPPAPAPRRIKRTICRSCGAPKQLPPKTGWVYCDHCGTLTDWDFRTACTTPGSALPGPAYEAVLAACKPRIDAARQKGDAAEMRAAQIQVFTAWAEACPASLPPRAKQEGYRKKYVAWMAEAAVVSELDADWSARVKAVAARTGGIRFIGDPRKPKVDPAAFWPLTDALEKQLERGMELFRQHGVVEMHPDGIPEEMQSQLTWSVFVQGWVPMLPEADAEKLLARTGLAGDYDTVPAVTTSTRHCGGCNTELRVLPGATCVVCESCGERVDVKADEIPCTQCGTRFSFPEQVARSKCPSCDTMVARV